MELITANRSCPLPVSVVTISHTQATPISDFELDADPVANWNRRNSFHPGKTTTYLPWLLQMLIIPRRPPIPRPTRQLLQQPPGFIPT